MTGRAYKMVSTCIFWAVVLLIMLVSANSSAQQIKFGDWIGSEKTDPATNATDKQIGTFAADGKSSLWLAVSDSGEQQMKLILKSDKLIASDYFSYRIDRVDNLIIRSAAKGCNDHCLADLVPSNGELIKNMRRGLRIKFQYEALPDMTQKPAFSLRGFSRAYNWLLAD